MDAFHVYVRALALGCFYSHIRTRTFRKALTASLVPESDARSVVPTLSRPESSALPISSCRFFCFFCSLLRFLPILLLFLLLPIFLLILLAFSATPFFASADFTVHSSTFLLQPMFPLSMLILLLFLFLLILLLFLLILLLYLPLLILLLLICLLLFLSFPLLLILPFVLLILPFVLLILSFVLLILSSICPAHYSAFLLASFPYRALPSVLPFSFALHTSNVTHSPILKQEAFEDA